MWNRLSYSRFYARDGAEGHRDADAPPAVSVDILYSFEYKRAVVAVDEIASLALLIFVAATIYSSVGHGGASGYLAAMALFGLAPVVMKPTALALNIVVASLASVRLGQANLVAWRPLVPLCAMSIPAAFV